MQTMNLIANLSMVGTAIFIGYLAGIARGRLHGANRVIDAVNQEGCFAFDGRVIAGYVVSESQWYTNLPLCDAKRRAVAVGQREVSTGDMAFEPKKVTLTDPLPDFLKPQAAGITLDLGKSLTEAVERSNVRHAAMVKVCGTHSFLDPVSHE